MECPYSHPTVFAMLVAASLSISGCADRLPTDPTIDPKAASFPGPRLSYHSECDEMVDPGSNLECCAENPNYPGCDFWFCTEEQRVMAEEYTDPQYANSLRPSCSDFAAGGGTANFSWAELNGRGPLSSAPYGNLHWDPERRGATDSRLTTGLENTRSIYNRGGIALSGGYRCPHGNAQLPTARPNSFHTHGRAADMYSADHGGTSWTLAECNLLRDAVLQTGPMIDEVLECDHYTDLHLHAAW
jgi:hypothetical protein